MTRHSVLTKNGIFRDFDVVRNAESVSEYVYNCGGFALETYDWFLPFFDGDTLDEIEEVAENCGGAPTNFNNDFDKIFYQDEFENEVEEVMKDLGISPDLKENMLEDIVNYNNFSNPIAFKIAVRHILNSFPDIRQIEKISEVAPDENGIIYGTSRSDFHFAKFVNGVWYHKKGCNEVEVIDSWIEALQPSYNGPIAMFAKKKKN